MSAINVEKSSISAQLVEAYVAAEYEVHTTPAFVMHIGYFSRQLKALYVASHANSAAFITAFNPTSEALDVAENLARNELLAQYLAKLQFDYVDGAGKSVGDAGSGELSFLVLGIDQITATELADQFGQNAIVWCDANALPHLLLLK
jgi:hypothetical protein